MKDALPRQFQALDVRLTLTVARSQSDRDRERGRQDHAVADRRLSGPPSPRARSATQSRQRQVVVPRIAATSTYFADRREGE